MNLRPSAELCGRWSVSLSSNQAQDILGEHRRILWAVHDRNADGAVAALSEHIRNTSRRLDPEIAAATESEASA